jgi:predicted enzyme related to lactoylglutathione lyase
VVDISVSFLTVVVDCRDPRAQAEFWARVLGREARQRNTDEYQVNDPSSTTGSLYFMKVPEPKIVKNRVHWDLVTSGSIDDEIAVLTEAGAKLVAVRQDPDSLEIPNRWAVMLEPEGNEFCVTSSTTLSGWT